MHVRISVFRQYLCNFPGGTRGLSYRLSAYTTLRPNQPPIKWVPDIFAAAVERPERKGDRPLTYSPPYASMVCIGIPLPK